MNKIGACFDAVLKIMRVAAGVILIGTMLIIGISVVTRYFFNRPIGFAQEFSEYGLVIITFLTIAWVLKEEGHVSMDLLTNHLKPKAKAMTGIITSAVCVVVGFVIFYKSAEVVRMEFELGYVTYTQLAPPKFIFTSFIVLGLFTLSLQLIRRTYGFIKQFIYGDKESEGGE
ncbi:MAG: TRAP transporter small permease [Clostridiales Family XIII bacterium]|jgi:TRAP-type C4-dicarboxylate transport system permease small subunit|nr:TRAP transporter small permease [Clostridiales Family XIII bacterium]